MSAEPVREFVDTNLLVYAFDTSAESKHVVARDLLHRLWEDRNGCLSVQVLQEFYITVTKKIPNPLPAAQALDIVREFATWTTHAPGSHDVEAAIRLHLAMQWSFWDAMVVNSALRLNCSILWSEDLSHGQHVQDLRVLSPFHTDAQP